MDTMRIWALMALLVAIGFATGEAVVKLVENNGITKLTYSVEANVGGKIAQLGSRLIDMTAKKMADIFFGKFSDLLTSNKEKKGTNMDKEKNTPEQSSNSFKMNKYIFLLSSAVIIFIAIYLIK